MSLFGRRSETGSLLNDLRGIAESGSQDRAREETIEGLGGPVHNFHFPGGADVAHLLDRAHMPATTRFETVVLLPGLADVRFQHPSNYPDAVREYPGDSDWLKTISQVARDGLGYDRRNGVAERNKYLAAMTLSLDHLLKLSPPSGDAIIVPVERAGGNLARSLGLRYPFSIEAKRLRFDGNRDLLGVGINLPQYLGWVGGRPVALIEAFLASGSTVAGTILALRNREISVPLVDCYAVVACPAGADYLRDFRSAVADSGADYGVFAGGELNRDWYVDYSNNDPLLLKHPGVAQPNDAVGGDAGEFTSL